MHCCYFNQQWNPYWHPYLAINFGQYLIVLVMMKILNKELNQQLNYEFIIIFIIKAVFQLCWGQLYELYFSIPINILHIYFYYLHQRPLWPAASPWWAINLLSQTLFYQRHCRFKLDVPKPFQMDFSNFTPYCRYPLLSKEYSTF